jgi:NADH:ubiquinone oxidoreductase subunit 5 (subunit L)/multisubunit Na+/H+ antiporter MnhA subunit
LYGILLIILEFNSSEISVLLGLVPFLHFKFLYCCGLSLFLLNTISFFLILGSFGKSAQLGFHL